MGNKACAMPWCHGVGDFKVKTCVCPNKHCLPLSYRIFRNFISVQSDQCLGALFACGKQAAFEPCLRTIVLSVAHRSNRILFVLWSGHCFSKDAQSCGSALVEGRGGNGPKDAW